MNVFMYSLMGLIVGYIVGIALAALFAFVIGWEEAARVIAIGSGLLGALTGPSVFGRFSDTRR